MERRAFLKAVAIAGATARMMRASWPRIKLSLSGRISEPIGQVADLKPLTYDEFLQVAKSTDTTPFVSGLCSVVSPPRSRK